MRQLTHHDPLDAVAAAPARQTRLRALLFTCAAVGTTLLIVTTASPKFPPGASE